MPGVQREAARGSAVARRVALGFLLGIALPCSAQEAVVGVQRHGETIVIDVEMSVPATANSAWSVLTDYENMASFLTNLTSSTVIHRKGNSLEVAQAGHTKVAFMTFSFSAIRAVELSPKHEIRSSLVGGDFKSYVSTTKIMDAPGGVKVQHHGEYVPKAWMPPMIGPAIIESETKKQYGEFAAEIIKREAASRR
jgi:ribosome-associated toxin RatA of RatAB toxin-antitoxin module